MIKSYPFLKKIVPIIFFLFTIVSFSQTTGDFQSKTTGNWTSLTSWETWDGTTWVAASNYPGQIAGTGSVLVKAGHQITMGTADLSTSSMGTLTIDGTLTLNGGSNGGTFTINTPNLIITSGLTPYANINFANKVTLNLPTDVIIQVGTGGLPTPGSGTCTANIEIWIGGSSYAYCTGGGSAPEFSDIIADGGYNILDTVSATSVCGSGTSTISASVKPSPLASTTYSLFSSASGGTALSSTTSTVSPFSTSSLITPSISSTTTYYVEANTGTLKTPRKAVTVTVNTNTWNGASNEDWNNSANWSCGVPTISTDVLIPTIPTGGKFPILTAFTASTYPQGYVKNIVFQSGSTLIIENNALNIAGNLTLNGKIDLNGESQLLQDIGSTLDATSTGTIEIDQQGEGNKYRYNYWSMPVYTLNDVGGNYTTIAAALRDGTNPSPGAIAFTPGYDGSLAPFTLSSFWMYKFVDSGAGYSAWDHIGSTEKLYTGQGFSMKGPGAPGSPAQNYTFVGKPNNGTIELTVAENNDYLVGNPYPSAIDAEQFLYDNGPNGNASITGAIYYWEHYGGDTHNLSGYQGGYATYSYGGGSVPAASFPGLGGGVSVKGAPGQYIPVGQAFFVVGDDVDGGQIQFNNGQRAFEKESDGNSIFMKNSNTKLKRENTHRVDLRPKFRIGFDAPKISHRQLLLTIDERATKEVDWGFDAEIYEVFADDMYWMLNNKKYVIQGTNEVGLKSEVPLGVQLSKSGMVTVKIDAMENVDDDTSIYLKDKVTGESYNMRGKPVQLNLNAGKYADRFVIVFKTQKLVTEDVVAELLIPAAAQPIIEGIHVFMNNATGELQIKNNSTEEITSVALINAVGQTVKTWNSNFNIRTISLPISTSTGIYFVQINTKTGNTVKKICVE